MLARRAPRIAVPIIAAVAWLGFPVASLLAQDLGLDSPPPAASQRPAASHSAAAASQSASARTVEESEPVVTRRGYSLQRCLDLADRNYPKIAEARAHTNYYRAQLDEARFAPFSQWTMTGGIGLAPTVRGGPIYSPNTDASLTSNLGLAWRVTLEGLVPLWTFGKITNLADAAEAQVKVGQYQVQKERNQVKLDVRKAYFGLQLARSSLRLLVDAGQKLDDAADTLQKQIDEGEGDDIDLLKLRTYRAELEARTSEARRYEAIALSGLRFMTGVASSFDVDSDALKPAKHKLGPVARYLQAARLYRPEINMARAGVEARRAQVALAQAKMYPDVGVGLSASYARAPEVADQINPYVRDDANYFRYGFALAMRWSLDLMPGYARLEQARAQLEETRATERFALGGVGLEVETAYSEAVDASNRERAYGRAEGYAKQWLIAIQQGIDVGTQEEKDLIDPARQYATQRFNHLNAIMDLNMALSKLSLVTGWDTIAPDGT